MCLALERVGGASMVLLFCHGTSSDLGMSRYTFMQPFYANDLRDTSIQELYMYLLSSPTNASPARPP